MDEDIIVSLLLEVCKGFEERDSAYHIVSCVSYSHATPHTQTFQVTPFVTTSAIEERFKPLLLACDDIEGAWQCFKHHFKAMTMTVVTPRGVRYVTLKQQFWPSECGTDVALIRQLEMTMIMVVVVMMMMTMMTIIDTIVHTNLHSLSLMHRWPR